MTTRVEELLEQLIDEIQGVRLDMTLANSDSATKGDIVDAIRDIDSSLAGPEYGVLQDIYKEIAALQGSFVGLSAL